jgi:methyl-accepting chemotaxis protein
MRTNLPVTGREVELADGEVIVSHTDTKGKIVSINRSFVRISGFTEVELIGQPHNIVRHPDMPEAAFADFWSTLKAGRPWVGMVKNRCKNGDHYWVEAHATPLFDGETVTGYMSVRKKPTRAQVAEAERAYALLRSGKGGLRVVRGQVKSGQLLHRLNPLWLLNLRTRLFLAAGGVIGLGLALILLGEHSARWWLLGAGGAFALYSAWWLGQDIGGRLQHAVSAFRRVAAGDYESRLPIDRDDSIGKVLMGLQSMQVRLGFETQETKMKAAE